MNPSASTLGLAVGLALGFAGAFGGFGAFLVVLLLGAIGLGVGRYLDGQLDLSALIGRSQDRVR
ncbi:MAG: hypothetical protein JF887_00370 [Candidatus Dormibacteraeota bacterium]|uniref:DUF2273 domain-containing protein n=1 Tax=Candidatus Amunia macphersoniae TaxID=3127014 RepID=A0A934KCP1_9BACT|nr:hypothetical protein [Candidatus Dormibacteraeota bacterium]